MKNAVLALVAAGLSSVLPAGAATMSTQLGDLVLTVYEDIGGGQVGPKTFSVNLGSATDFKNSQIGVLDNIDSELNTVFETADWTTKPTLRFVVVGSTGLMAGNAGDPVRTTYAGTALTSMAQAGETTYAGVFPGNYGTFCDTVAYYVVGINGKPDDMASDARGAITTEFVPNKEKTLYFSTGASNIVAKGMAPSETNAVAFDLWRMYNSAPGAAIVAENLGTLVISKTGDISWDVDDTVLVSPSFLTAGAEGDDTLNFGVTAAGSWTVSVSEGDEEWLFAEKPTSGTVVSVEVGESKVTEARTGYITVTSGSVSRTVVVTQAAFVPMLTVAEANTTKNVADFGGSFFIEVTSNVPELWEVEKSDAWITIVKATDNASAEVTVAANSAGVRTGSVTIYYGYLRRTVNISQDAFVTRTLSVSPTSKNVAVEGETFDVTVTTNSAFDWSATAPSWVTLTDVDDSTLRVFIPYNYGAERNAIITVTGGGKTGTVTIKQASFDANITVAAPTSKSVVKEGESAITINVTSNVEWKAICPPWITVSKTDGGENLTTGTFADSLTINVLANTGASRSGRVTFVGGGTSDTFTVNQGSTEVAKSFDVYDIKIATKTSEIKEMGVKFHNAQDKNANFKLHYRAPVNKTYTLVMAYAYDNDDKPFMLDSVNYPDTMAGYGLMWASDKEKRVFEFNAERTVDSKVIGNKGMNYPTEVVYFNTNDPDAPAISLKGLATLAKVKNSNETYLLSSAGFARAQGMYPATFAFGEQGYASTDPNKEYGIADVIALGNKLPDGLKKQPAANNIYYPAVCLVEEDEDSWFLEGAHFHGTYTMRFNKKQTDKNSNDFDSLETLVKSLVPAAKK